ncbi:hypothetical protein QUB68_02670 [Microcoleus sp. A006_D1]|uniref:hypothetical protein n=1 Tax=Microcoleus sp. A006_D1 TaxID=3055267 RepID=UPI002FCE7F9B
MADEAKVEAAKPDPLVFKGVCSEGILKGKEIEGKLDLKVIVTSAKAKEAPAPKKSEWEPVFFWALFALMANFAVGDPAGMRKYSPPQRSHSHEMLNQSGEQSVLPQKNTTNLPL